MEGRRPVVTAVVPGSEEEHIIPHAGSWQEDAAAIHLARYLSPFYSILTYPFRRTITVVYQLGELIIRRHSPLTLPIRPGRIIFQIQHSLIIHDRTVITIGVVLGLCFVAAVTPFV